MNGVLVILRTSHRRGINIDWVTSTRSRKAIFAESARVFVYNHSETFVLCWYADLNEGKCSCFVP